MSPDQERICHDLYDFMGAILACKPRDPMVAKRARHIQGAMAIKLGLGSARDEFAEMFDDLVKR